MLRDGKRLPLNLPEPQYLGRGQHSRYDCVRKLLQAATQHL